MNALGMSRDACLAALRHYLNQVEHLAEALGDPNPHDRRGHADELLETLQFEVSVDVALRADPDRHHQMGEIEKAVFEPALGKIQATVQRLGVSRASALWLPAVVELEAMIRDAVVMSAHRRPSALFNAWP